MPNKSLLALAVLGTAQAQAAVLLTQGFNDYDALAGAGYVLINASLNVGSAPTWGWGDPNIFSAHAGSPNSYLSANFNNAASGPILNWFLTPGFSTAAGVVVRFQARSADDPGYVDSLAFGFSAGSAAPAEFALGPVVQVPGQWTQYTATLGARGAGSVGRFAIAYAGDYATSDFIGIDTLDITQLPEPASVLLLGAGLGLLALGRRIGQP